jgi:hypothetical protein
LPQPDYALRIGKAGRGVATGRDDAGH